MSDETTLLPCPICGGQPDFQHFNITPNVKGRIICACGLSLVQGKNDTEDDMRIIWNTRTYGTLTAEQVRELIAPHLHARPTFDFGRHGAVWVADFQAIADELNAELGSGTCKITATATNNLMYPDYMTKWYELSCGHSLTLKGDEAPKWCAVCGKAVER